MRAAAPRISVVVPTHQRRASVLRLLCALGRQTLPPADFEVVVVVDGSDDGTREELASLIVEYPLRVLWQPNAGRAAACNAGIRSASGELVLVLDDDMEPTPGLLAAHLEAHLSAEPLGVVGAVPIRVHAQSPPVVRFVAAKFNAHLASLAAGVEIRFRSFYSGNFSIRRELITEIGLYDESFRIYGNEDTELSLRLLRAGVRLYYRADAVAYQHYDKDFEALARDNFAKGKTAVLAVFKHPEEFGEFSRSRFRAQSGKWSNRSRKWKLLRGAVLRLAPVLPVVPRGLLAIAGWLERRRSPWLQAYYGFAVDCFFWLGVESVDSRAAAARGPIAATDPRTAAGPAWDQR